jgi:fluoride exporter
MNILLIAIGGAIGAVLRYLITDASAFLLKSAFPLGIFLVNFGGCFLMGVVHFVIIHHLQSLSHEVRLLVATGLLGGFTTFSAFGLDVLRLASAGQWQMAAIYAFTSLFLCILAVFCGYYLMKVAF